MLPAMSTDTAPAVPIADGIAPGTDVTASHVGGIDPGSRAVRSRHTCRNLGCAFDTVVGADGIPRFHVHAHADDLIACWA